MAQKPLKEAELITDLKLDGSWDKHIDSVRPAIKELDRQQMQAVAQAPSIIVTNQPK